MKKIQKVASNFRQKLAETNSLQELLVLLRAASHIHQTNHWQTFGQSYYGDHQLFERLYNEGQEAIDAVAERAVGAFSADQVDGVNQIESVSGVVKGVYSKASGDTSNDMVVRSVAIEEMVVEKVKVALEQLDSTNELSHGISNLLEDVADKRESFLYLLGQRSKHSNE